MKELAKINKKYVNVSRIRIVEMCQVLGLKRYVNVPRIRIEGICKCVKT